MRLCPLLAGGLATISTAQSPPLSVKSAVELAIGHRPAILAARIKVVQAQANRSALGAYLPTRAEFGKGTLPDIQGGEDFLIAQPIDVFGKANAGRASGTAAIEGAQASLVQSELDVQSDVMNAFADAQSSQSLFETGKAIADISERVFASTKQRVDRGDLPPAQLLRADLDLQRAKQTVKVRVLALQSAKQRLSGAMGVPVDQLGTVDSDNSQLQLTVDVTDRRPDLLQAKADIDSARADVRQGRLTAMPDVEIQFRRSPFSEAERYGARIQFVMPLWDWGASRSRVHAAQSAERSATATLQDRRSTAQSEVRAAQIDFDSAKSSVASFDRLKSDALTLLQKEQRGFDLGASTLLDVLDATRALREIDESLADAQSKLVQSAAKLLAVTGTLLSSKENSK